VRSIDVTKLLKAEFDKAAKTVNQSVKQAIKEIKSKNNYINLKAVIWLAWTIALILWLKR
jgi:hypothetical protein